MGLDTLPSALEWLPAQLVRWLPGVAAVLSPFVLHYLYTSVRFLARTTGTRDGVEPPVVPYAVPFIGHTLPFAFDTAKYMSYLASKFNSPVKVLVGGDPMYFIPHGAATIALFKFSREFTNGAVAERVMGDTFGLPRRDLELSMYEKSGLLAQPTAGWEGIDPAKRWNYLTHNNYHAYLMGTSLAAIGEMFVQRFARLIGAGGAGEEEEDGDREGEAVESSGRLDFGEDEWTHVPDLYVFLKKNMFHAATAALYGDELARLNPSLCRDFWELDSGLPHLFRRVPRWIVPKTYAVREKVLEHIKAWQAAAWEQMSSEQDEACVNGAPGGEEGEMDGEGAEAYVPEWDPVVGSKLARSRLKTYRDFGLSDDGKASYDLGMMWAANANSIPSTMWALRDILLDKDLTARLVTEVDSCFRGTTLDLDVQKLGSLTLLTAVYLETLRLRAASPIGRTPIADTFRLGRWRFSRDVPIFSTSWLGGHDPTFWNEGTIGPGPDGKPKAKHPVEEFWAERFLEYPDDPSSGPIRKTDAAAPGKNARSDPNITGEGEKAARPPPRIVTSGMAGNFYPYGGGLNICPGRFFAKQEIMAGVAFMLRAFEFDIVDADAWRAVKPDMGYFPFGIVPPKGQMPVRMRRRRLS